LETAAGGDHDTTTETAPPESEDLDGVIPAAPSDLAQTCAHDRITDPDTGGEALVECEKLCLKGSCCWQPNAKLPCTDNSLCAAYQQPCSVFQTIFEPPPDYVPEQSETLAPHVITQVPAAAQTIGLTCSPDVLKTTVDSGKFIVQCERECLLGACCWKKNHPTICPDAAECAAYQEPCGTNLVNALESLETGGTAVAPARPTAAPTPLPTPPPTSPPVQIETNVPDAPSDLQIMCSQDVLKLTVNGGEFIVQCEKECLAGACCWKEGHPTVCPDAPQCADYEIPCKEHLVPALNEIEGTDHGLALSAPTSSASTGGTSNSDSGTSSTQAPTIPAAPSDIQLRCSLETLNNNPEGRGFCEESCYKASCCWAPDGTEDECANEMIAVNCGDYAPCENLLGMTQTESTSSSGADSGNSNAIPGPPAPPSDLKDTCAAASIVTMQGLGRCRVDCQAAACCWRTDSQSCSSAANCVPYVRDCELMRKELSLTEGGAIKDEIGGTCDDKSTSYVKANCETLCRPGSCCFDDSAACSASIDCTTYEACSVLNRRMLRQR